MLIQVAKRIVNDRNVKYEPPCVVPIFLYCQLVISRADMERNSYNRYIHRSPGVAMYALPLLFIDIYLADPMLIPG